MDKTARSRLLVISIFAIAMGMLESAVVIYLRDIQYPGGFEFPLNPLRPDLVWTEILREVATLVMLLGVGILAGRYPAERFAWFLYTFAIWDIFYYIFLWILIGWPESLMTWDVLFLIPVTWTGPVITPLIVSGSMILFALMIVRRGYGSRETGQVPRINRLCWLLLISGSVILIIAFTWDYSGFVLEQMSFRDIWTLPGSRIQELIYGYVPRKFNWPMFGLGELLIAGGIFLFWRNTRPVKPPTF